MKNEALFIWNEKLNYKQKVIFSIIAESVKREGNELTFGYNGFSDTVIENLKKIDPETSSESMGGLISRLHDKGLTFSEKGTSFTNDSQRDEITLSLKSLGMDLIKNHYEVIEKFIIENNVKCLSY